MACADRVACVDVPELPLQLLLRREPGWRDLPVVVVQHDKPQGVVLWVNETARAARVLPGMRYADALSLVRTLRAGVVPDSQIRTQVDAIRERLRGFTPEIEASSTEPGVFWLDAVGLTPLFASFTDWASAIVTALRQASLLATVVVGFTRYGTYALAKAASGAPDRCTVFAHAADEQHALARVRIARLGFEPALRDALHTLGIDTLGAFAALPAPGVLRRFGPSALRLHRLVRNDLWAPIAADPASETFTRRLELDRAETDLLRLMAVLERLVRDLLDTLVPRALLVTQITVQLHFESRQKRREVLRPASPTRSARVLLQLVHLRLETLALGAGVEELEIHLDVLRETPQQLDLFAVQPRRDRKAGDRALARLRAEFGDDVVVHAVLRDAHLPEARFQWLRCDALVAPAPLYVELPPLVRRLLPRPLALPPRPRREPDGWLVAGPAVGPVEEIVGPHVIAGGWWLRGVERAYHFVRTQSGAWLWIYEDRRRRRWFLHGYVE